MVSATDFLDTHLLIRVLILALLASYFFQEFIVFVFNSSHRLDVLSGMSSAFPELPVN